jgi:hypothetical protein
MSAQVEEVTASAQSLSEMANALEQVVKQFKLQPMWLKNRTSLQINQEGWVIHPLIIKKHNIIFKRNSFTIRTIEFHTLFTPLRFNHLLNLSYYFYKFRAG